MDNNNGKKDIFKDGFNFNFQNTEIDETEGSLTESSNESDINIKKEVKASYETEENLNEMAQESVATLCQPLNENEHKSNKNFLENLNKNAAESFQEEKFTYEKTNYTKYIIQFVFLGIIIAAAIIFLNQKVEVVDFTNMAHEDVVAWANNNKVIITSSNDTSNEIKENHIISQNVQPGTKVKKNTHINVIVSDGLDPYEKISVPEFDSTWSKSSITQWVEQNGIENFNFVNIENEKVEVDYLISYRLIGAKKQDFTRSSEIEFTISNTDSGETVTVNEFLNNTLAQVDVWAKNNDINYSYTYEYSTIYPKDKIMYQSISSGEEMYKNDTITFVVSDGPPEVLEMGNFLNRTLIEADIWAKNNGVKYTYSYAYSSIYGKDMIMSQSIVSGEELSDNVTILFVVSKGQWVTVPSYSSMNKLQAQNYGQGIIVEIVETYKDGTNLGDFISQAISSGTKVEENTTITINYSLGDKVTIPNFRGELKVDLEGWIRGINNLGANLTLIINEEYSSDVEYGKIISQDIYNDDVALNSSITILVSLGESHEVNDFSSMTRSEIQSYCDSNGLTVVFEEVADSELTSGSFINQFPAAGEIISKKDFITIQIVK